MGIFHAHRTITEQGTRLSSHNSDYENTTPDRIYIDDQEFLGFSEYSYTLEKSYKTQPVRTIDGQIVDLENYETFTTPRLVIKYNAMEIDEYRDLMDLIIRKNVVSVNCYDPISNSRVVHNMYFATPQMPKYYQRYLNFLGVLDYTIELIGTNTALEYG